MIFVSDSKSLISVKSNIFKLNSLNVSTTLPTLLVRERILCHSILKQSTNFIGGFLTKKIQHFQLVVGAGKPKQGNYVSKQNDPRTEEGMPYMSNSHNRGLTFQYNY